MKSLILNLLAMGLSVLTAVVAAPLSAQDNPPATPLAQADPAHNIGFVVYSLSPSPGTLHARWNYGSRWFGPGIATGGPPQGFEGRFHVRYFYEDGTFSDEYDLEIVPRETFYDVYWRVDGELRAIGVGMLVEDGRSLAVGWRRVEPGQ